MASFQQSLRVFRSANAKVQAAGLFREAFNCEFPVPADYRILDTTIHPEDWHQYVAMYTWPDGIEECVGFCNWLKYKDVYLEGGIAVQSRFYRKLEKPAFAECSRLGGIAQIIMETAARDLTDCVAWFGHCGDKRALRVDMRVGFVQIDDPHLIVKWMRPVDEAAKLAWIDEIKRIGPF
ncbi:MAG: hypothetical protein ABI905_05640 [Betaproteobacteria bacterium]